MFVVEWDDAERDQIIAVHTWDQWLKIPIMERNWNTETIWANDVMAAYTRAMRGECGD